VVVAQSSRCKKTIGSIGFAIMTNQRGRIPSHDGVTAHGKEKGKKRGEKKIKMGMRLDLREKMKFA